MRIRASSISEASQTDRMPRPTAPARFRLALGQPSVVWAVGLLPHTGLGECHLSVRVGPTLVGLRTVYVFRGYSAHGAWLTLQMDPFQGTRFVEIRVHTAEAAVAWTCVHVFISTQSGQPHDPTQGYEFPATPSTPAFVKSRSLPNILLRGDPVPPPLRAASTPGGASGSPPGPA